MTRVFFWILTVMLAAGAVAPGAAQAAETLVVDLGGDVHQMKISGCRAGDDYYLIDAQGENATINILGALTGDQTYTTIDFFYVDAGEDKRAGTSGPPIPLVDGAFAFVGDVDISDGTTAEMRVNFAGC